jgi:ATP-dependent Lon protease
MGYDLSKVMFIATSNTMSSIQPALETVEIIKNVRLYDRGKGEIARQHLLQARTPNGEKQFKVGPWSVVD